MADLETKRIINLAEENAPAEGDCLVVDNESTGTKKLPITSLIEPASAEGSAKAVSSGSLYDFVNKTDDVILNVGRKIINSFPIHLHMEYGAYGLNGYVDSKNYVRSQILPAGKYNISVVNGYLFDVYQYVSDSSGTAFVTGRTNEIINVNSPVVVTLKHAQVSKFTYSELITIQC